MPYSCAVGIDVSKHSLDLCILRDTEINHSKFKNSPKGIQEVIKYLSKNNVSELDPIVIESTGDFHLMVAFKLNRQFTVKIINPLMAKQFMTSFVRKVKTDKADSLSLAKLGAMNELKTHTFTLKELHKRKLITQIAALEKHLSAIKLSTKNIKKIFNDFDLHSKSLTKVEDEVKKFNKLIDELQNELFELVENKDLVRSLSKQSGITEKLATRIVAILEDRIFKSKSAVVAYAGLDVESKESGKWRGKTKITKRGNQILRKYLVQIGWGLLMHNDYFKEYIQTHKERGRKYIELMVIIARKFLRMLFGAMKNENIFVIN